MNFYNNPGVYEHNINAEYLRTRASLEHKEFIRTSIWHAGIGIILVIGVMAALRKLKKEIDG